MVFDPNKINMAQRLEKSLKKERNIYIPLFAAPFGLKKGRNLQFICNANKVILARETE
jgi:hypothetical protein